MKSESQDNEAACIPESICRALQEDPRLVERARTETSVYSGSFFELTHLQVELPDASRATREIVRHCGGAGVLVIDRAGRVCLVRQWRCALGRMTLEIPAGKLGQGESPEQCAARELREETGLVAKHLVFLARAHGMPGFSDESTSIFSAHELHETKVAPDADEFVDVVWVPLEDVVLAIRLGVITDAKTIVAVLSHKAGLDSCEAHGFAAPGGWSETRELSLIREGE